MRQSLSTNVTYKVNFGTIYSLSLQRFTYVHGHVSRSECRTKSEYNVF